MVGTKEALADPNDRRRLRRGAADHDRRALFFKRTHVFCPSGKTYALTGSHYVNANCWVGMAVEDNEGGLPKLFTIQAFVQDPAFRGSFKRELAVLKIMEKRKDAETVLPKYFDDGVTSRDVSFILTTFVGPPLSHHLQSFNVPLRPTTCYRIGLSITRALIYLHDEKIIHGNVSTYSVLTGNGLSSDRNSVRLGGFYYATIDEKDKPQSYPLNAYTPRCIHNKESANMNSDWEGLMFLLYDLYIGLPWRSAASAKEALKQKEAFVQKRKELNWDRTPEVLPDLADQIAEQPLIDGPLIEAAFLSHGLNLDHTVGFEWAPQNKAIEAAMNRPTEVKAGFFYQHNKKDENKQRIHNLKAAVVPDR